MKRITRLMLGTAAIIGIAVVLGTGLGAWHVTDTAQAAGAPLAQSSPTQLTAGCNLVALTNLTVGMKVSDWVQQNIKPASAVEGIWHFDNATQHYQAAYFKDPAVPVDAPTFTSSTDGYFICVNAAATAPAP